MSEANKNAIYKNHLLFTEHFLETRVKEMPGWNTEDSKLHEKMAKLREERKNLATYLSKKNEGQAEDRWVKWIFEKILELPYEVKVRLDYGDTHGEADYIFTETPEQAMAFTKEKYRPADLIGAIAVGEAKAWTVDLDKAVKERSPHKQLEEYLNYSELPWGILTNGRYWRLYERNSCKYNNYYVIDLEALLEENDIHQFLYFYMFFRREAFTTGWLNKVLKDSRDYAESLRDTLENQVFSALEDIAQGFLEYQRNELEKPPTTELLDTIYEESLVLLYRLLFVFYAESRGILPISNGQYEQRSLKTIAVSAKDWANFPNKRNADDDDLYHGLRRLFFLIDAGDKSFNIPAYNGKLFSAKEHAFLDKKIVGDVYLSRAIDKLARIEVKRGRKKERVTVDYQDLAVSHLGSIYEKLLEYELACATENLVISKNGDYKPARTNQTPDILAGRVYLRTGNNQRKITGSYYTPDYIVRFIVEKTLQPLLLEITERYATRNDDGNWQVSNPVILRDAILAINVLDPATGSGHFAVDVVVYIAEWLFNLALELPEFDTTPDLSYWMRQVASSCIYAVDINPLAVELAKLSIWLKTLAKDKPLSFLNHHIRVGNSLVGVKRTDEIGIFQVEKENEQSTQLRLFGDEAFTINVKYAVGQMSQIETVNPNDISDIKRQEEMYDELRNRLKPYEQLANLWTAREFGLKIDNANWQSIQKKVLGNKPEKSVQKLIDEAEKIANQRNMRFFHWDVAFPEVFFDETGARRANPGFDAIIGNPPYVRQETITLLKTYLEHNYEVYKAEGDLYLYFLEKALSLLSPHRHCGFITTSSFTSTDSASEFRKYFHKNASLKAIVDFGAVQPFKGVDLASSAMISVIENSKLKPDIEYFFIEGRQKPELLSEHFRQKHSVVEGNVTSLSEWRFIPSELKAIFERLINSHPSLIKRFGDIVYSGIKTSLTDAFVVTKARAEEITKDGSSKDILRNMLRGRHIKGWYNEYSDDYLISTTQGIELEKYPNVQQHLLTYKADAEKRSEVLSGQVSWYELRPCDYYHVFDMPKIVCSNSASKWPRFVWDTENLIANDSVVIIAPATLTLLALLNSRVLWFVISQIASPSAPREGYVRYQPKKQFIERLPIPELNATQESDLATMAETITSVARERYKAHEEMRQTISRNLGNGSPISNGIELYQWWQFKDEAALNADLSRRDGFSEIPVRKLTEWRQFLADEKKRHDDFTQKIRDEETRLNDIVYDAFGLDKHSGERALIEAATKYPYGEV